MAKLGEMWTNPWSTTEENDPSTVFIFCFPKHGK